MPHVEIQEGTRYIRIASEYREKELTRLVPGVRYDRDEQVWRVPLSWAACCQLRGVFGDSLEIGPELTAWAWNEVKTRIEPCMALREAEDLPESDPVLGRLRELGIG